MIDWRWSETSRPDAEVPHWSIGMTICRGYEAHLLGREAFQPLHPRDVDRWTISLVIDDESWRTFRERRSRGGKQQTSEQSSECHHGTSSCEVMDTTWRV
jgi:hypothetical protein